MESMQIEFVPWKHDYSIGMGPFLICPDVSVVPALRWTLPTLSDSTFKTYTTFGQLRNMKRCENMPLKESIGSKSFHAQKGSVSNELEEQCLLNQLRTDLPYILSKLSDNQSGLNDNEVHVTKDRHNYKEEKYLPSLETDSLETASVIHHLSSNRSPDDILNARIESLSDDVFETESDTNRRLGFFPNHQSGNNLCLPFQEQLPYGTNTVQSSASHHFNSGDLTSSDSIDISVSSGSYTIDVDLPMLSEFECALDRTEKFIIGEESDGFRLTKACRNPVKQSENTGNIMPESYFDDKNQSTDLLELKTADREICSYKEKFNIKSVLQPEDENPYSYSFGKPKRASLALDSLTEMSELVEGACPRDGKVERACHVNIYQDHMIPETNNEATNCEKICLPSKGMDNKLSRTNENDIYIESLRKKQLQGNETGFSASPNSGGEVISCNSIDTARNQNASSDMAMVSESFCSTRNDKIPLQNDIETDLSHAKSDHKVQRMGFLDDLLHNHDSIDHKGFCKFRSLNDKHTVLKDSMNYLKKENEDMCSYIDKTEIEQFVVDVINVAINRLNTEFNEMMKIHEPVSKRLPPDTACMGPDHSCVQDDSAPNEISVHGDGVLMDYCELEGFSEDTYTSSLAPIPEVDPILETYSLESVFNNRHVESKFTVKEILPSIPEICNGNTECVVEKKAKTQTAEAITVGNDLQKHHFSGNNESNETVDEYALVEPEVEEQFYKPEEFMNIIEPFDKVQQVFGIQYVESKEDVDTLDDDISFNGESLDYLEWLLKENRKTNENRKGKIDLLKEDNNSDKVGDLNGHRIDHEMIQHTTVGSASGSSKNPTTLHYFPLKEVVTMDQGNFSLGSNRTFETKFLGGSTLNRNSEEYLDDYLQRDDELVESLNPFQDCLLSENSERNDTDRLVKHLETQAVILDGQCSDEYSKNKSDRASDMHRNQEIFHFPSDTGEGQVNDPWKNDEQTTERTAQENFDSKSLDLKNIQDCENQSRISETALNKGIFSYENDVPSSGIENDECVINTSENEENNEMDTDITSKPHYFNTSLQYVDTDANYSVFDASLGQKTGSRSDNEAPSHQIGEGKAELDVNFTTEIICGIDNNQGHVHNDDTDSDSVKRLMDYENEAKNISKGGLFEYSFDDKAIMVEDTKKTLDLNTCEQQRQFEIEFETSKIQSAKEIRTTHLANDRNSSGLEQCCNFDKIASKHFVSSLDTEANTRAGLLSKVLKSSLSNDLSRRQEYRRHSRYQSQSLNLDNSDRRQTDFLENKQLSLRKVKSLNTGDHQQCFHWERNFHDDSPLFKFDTYCMNSTRQQDEVDEFDDGQVNDVAEVEAVRQLDKEIIYGSIDTSCTDTTNYYITGAGKLTFVPKSDVLFDVSSSSRSAEKNSLADFCSDFERMYRSNNFVNEKDGENLCQFDSRPDHLQNQAGSPTKVKSLNFGQEKHVSDYHDSGTGNERLSTAVCGSANMAFTSNSFNLNDSLKATNTNQTNEAIKRRNAFKESTFQVKRLASQEFGRHDIISDYGPYSHANETPSPEIKEYINAIRLDETFQNRRSPQCRIPVHFSEQDEIGKQEREYYKKESFDHFTHDCIQNCKSFDRDASTKVKISSSRSIDYVRFSDMSNLGRTAPTAKERRLGKSHSEVSPGRHNRAVLGKSCFDDSIGLTSNQVKIDQFSKGKAMATRDRSLIDKSASQYFNQNNGRTGNNRGKPTDTDLAKKSRKTAGLSYRDIISGSQRRNKTFNSEMRIQEHLEKRQKDGPLSLTDAYGSMETNDNQTGHALSQSANHLSESMTSLSNRHAPAMSPSRQNTLQKQQSLQSFHSEINGEHRHEEGVKFERLKNLPEEDLMMKIKEIIGHMERLEDYHRGDGMRIQKMLGDMYWDYTHMREMIGDCMADSGYAVVSMTMLKTLNSIGIFKNDDVWFPTYYTYNTMWNFTDASSKLAKALSENDAVRLLTLNCGHKPYINAIHSKNVYYVIKASLSILHNIARNSGMKHLFDENKTSETIMPFLESEDEMLKILATLTIANIVDEEENKTIIAESGTIHDIVNWIEKSLSLPRRRYKGFTPQELTEGLNKLAVNDANKMRIVDEGALQLFLQMLQHDDIREQSSAARIVWTLSFDKDVRQKINENTELVSVMEKLTDSTNKSLQTNCSGALWIIRGENDVTMEKRPKTNKSKTHVFLSYAWADKEIVLAIRDRLRAEGYAIWIDIEKMGKATLDTMTEAIENSAVVLVCMSEKYKQSPNCRTEAEYTFQLKKDYIPLMMQKKYRPDGWVGTILGAKLYFDFSGKYPFEKSFQGLLKELRGRGKVTPNTTPGDSNENNHGNPAMVHSMSLSSHTSAGTPVHHMLNSAILNMGQEELIKWLRNIKLTECIPAFMEFDGRLLMQLKVMRSEAPEFFYQCLEKRLNMSLIEILKFTRALEELQ